MRTKGFTLIELMVVIVVIGIVLAFSIPSMNTSAKKFDLNYKNTKDKLTLARQKAISSNSSVTVDFTSSSVTVGSDQLTLYNGIALNAYSGGSATASITFNPGGATASDAVVELSGFGMTDSILVTISGYILAR